MDMMLSTVVPWWVRRCCDDGVGSRSGGGSGTDDNTGDDRGDD